MVTDKQITDVMIAKMVEIIERDIARREAGEDITVRRPRGKRAGAAEGAAPYPDFEQAHMEYGSTAAHRAAVQEESPAQVQHMAMQEDAAAAAMPAEVSRAPHRGYDMEEISRFFERDARRF